jgi:hypothetical protein
MQQGLSTIQGASGADGAGCADYVRRDPVASDAAFTSVGRFSLFARPL